MIAMALANDPDILIADEPTTALDVTVQAQILTLLAELQRKLGMAIVFITHDLGIVRRFADRVYVMRRGEVVEEGATDALFAAPQHAYTQDAARRRADRPQGAAAGRRAGRCSKAATSRSRSRSAAASLQGQPMLLRAVDRISLALQAGPDDRHRRRIRFRQVDARPRAAAAAAERGRDPLRRAATSRALDREAMRPLRRELQLVFQDPFGSLSPRMTVGQIITEGLLVHEPSLSLRRARRARRRGAARGRPRSRRCATATRTSSPAASASASPSPAP